MTPNSTQDYQAFRFHNTGLHNPGKIAASGGKPSQANVKPTIVGIWRLMERIHRGIWCDIFSAQPADALGSPRVDYAVKIVRDDSEDRFEAIRQIQAEAELTDLAKHPHLISVLDSDLRGSRPFIVMPRMAGQAIATTILRPNEQSPAQPIPVALWWVRQAAQALQVIHKSGWVHGDVAPQNLLVDTRGHVTLIDLGFARPIGSAGDDKFRGTPDFAAPEQLTGAACSPASDVFALGKVLAELMPDFAQQPESVTALLRSMIAEDPDLRPTTDELCEQLLQLEIETLHLHINPRDLFPKKVA